MHDQNPVDVILPSMCFLVFVFSLVLAVPSDCISNVFLRRQDHMSAFKVICPLFPMQQWSACVEYSGGTE